MGREKSSSLAFAKCLDRNSFNKTLSDSLQSTLPRDGPARRYDPVHPIRSDCCRSRAMRFHSTVQCCQASSASSSRTSSFMSSPDLLDRLVNHHSSRFSQCSSFYEMLFQQISQWLPTCLALEIRQWSLPGAAVVPVLNVSSRVFWLELDDKVLLDSYTVLQEGILCDVFSQKCSAAWQGAPGQRLTVAIMLPGRQDADDWLNFMLSQKNLWPTFTTRGTLTEEISEQTFRKERRRLQAKHLWMEVKLSWHVLADRMYTAAPTGKSREQLYALLFNKAARGSQKNPYEEKAYRGPALKAVQAWWEQCKEWMLYFKGQSAPLVQDLQGLLQAFQGKEEDARAEVEAFMEHCAKRWQTKEGTYQLKRRRLLPDVRDPPEQGNAEVDMKDI